MLNILMIFVFFLGVILLTIGNCLSKPTLSIFGYIGLSVGAAYISLLFMPTNPVNNNENLICKCDCCKYEDTSANLNYYEIDSDIRYALIGKLEKIEYEKGTTKVVGYDLILDNPINVNNGSKTETIKNIQLVSETEDVEIKLNKMSGKKIQVSGILSTKKSNWYYRDYILDDVLIMD